MSQKPGIPWVSLTSNPDLLCWCLLWAQRYLEQGPSLPSTLTPGLPAGPIPPSALVPISQLSTFLLPKDEIVISRLQKL